MLLLPKRGFIYLLTAVLVIFAGIAWAQMLYFVPRGFEFTDNGLYALNLRYPQDPIVSTTRYASLVHYLYLLAGEQLAGTRLFGAIIYLLSHILLGYSVWAFAQHELDYKLNPWLGIVGTTAIVSASLHYYSGFLPTPSYNWLTLIGLSWYVSGLLLWHRFRNTRYELVTVFFVGVGYCVLGWGKIPSALIALIFIIWFLVIHYRHLQQTLRLKVVGAGLAGVACVMVPGIIVEGSPFALYEHLMVALEYQQTLGSRLDSDLLFNQVIAYGQALIVTTTRVVQVIALPLLALIIVTFFLKHNSHKQKLYNFLSTLVFITVFVLQEKFYGVITASMTNWGTIGYWMTMVTLSALLVIGLNHLLVLSATTNWRKYIHKIPAILWMIGLLLTTPFIYSFGTNNAYIVHKSAAIHFLIATIVGLAYFLQNRMFLVTFSTLIIIFMSFLSNYHLETPYREPSSARNMTTLTPIRYGAEAVYIHQSTSDFLLDMQTSAERHCFEPGTHIIDLTGRSPGLVYALDGRSGFTNWFIGGYDWSNDFIRYTLERWPDDQVRNAWLLVSVNGPRAIELSVLEAAETNLGGYRHVATFRNPSYDSLDSLWKPAYLNKTCHN